MRQFGALFAGTLATAGAMVTFEAVADLLYPAAPTAGPVPLGALLLVWAGSVVGAVAGGTVIGRLAPTGATPLAVGLGVFFTFGHVANLQLIPQPTWFAVAGFFTFVPLAILGARRVKV